MPLCRSLLVLALIASASPAEDRLRTLKGDVYAGKLVRVSNGEIVFEKGTEQIVVPAKQVLNLELNAVEKLPDTTAFIDVELTDGTVLHCSECKIKGNTVHLTLLLTGQKVELPLGVVGNLLANAQNEKYRREWSERLRERIKKKEKKDVLAKLREGVVNGFTGLLGQGNEDGSAILFTPDGITDGKAVPVKIETVHGLIFTREIDPNAKPPICKLIDTHRNTIMVAAIEQNPDGLVVTTPAGAKLIYPVAKVALLDYSNGNLVYLSDIQPDRVVELSTEDRVDHFKRNQNMDGKERIRLKGTDYQKGLALHADCRLDFDLNGEFTVFKALAGFDDEVGGIPGEVKLRIEGDGKELFATTLDRKNWNAKSDPVNISLNVKDVQTLRVEVSSGDLLTLGKHLVLVDAKVTK